MRCSIFSFSFLSGGYLVTLILLSDTCPFLPLVSLFLFFEVPGTCPFLLPRIIFFSRFRALATFYFLVLFFSLSFFTRALISWNNVASGSNQNNWSIYFTGNNRDRKMFLAILSRIRSRIILGESGDGNEWMYVDAYFQSRSSIYEWTCKWILILTTWQAPKGLHSLTTLNAHK